MRRSLILTTLLSLRGVLADCGEEGGTIVIANDGGSDDDLNGCGVVHGDIVIDPAYVYFMVEGVSNITGTITAHDNRILKFLQAKDAEHVGGLSIHRPRISPRVDLARAAHVGRLELRGIWSDTASSSGAYQYYYGMEWRANLTSVGALDFEDTELDSLTRDTGAYLASDGFETLERAGAVRLVDNPCLRRFALPALREASGTIEIGHEGEGVVDLPLLERAGGIQVYARPERRACPWDRRGRVKRRLARRAGENRIDLPALTTVAGDVGVRDVAGLEAFEAPRLEAVEGDLVVANNAGFRALSLPALRRVGGDLVLDGGRAEDGGFTDLDLPSLEAVGGKVTIKTPSYNFDCAAFERRLRDVDVGGGFVCENLSGPQVSSADATGAPTATGTGTDTPRPTATFIDDDDDATATTTMTTDGPAPTPTSGGNGSATPTGESGSATSTGDRAVAGESGAVEDVETSGAAGPGRGRSWLALSLVPIWLTL